MSTNGEAVKTIIRLAVDGIDARIRAAGERLTVAKATFPPESRMIETSKGITVLTEALTDAVDNLNNALQIADALKQTLSL